MLAVVGCSTHTWKDAHDVPAVLQRMGFRVVPVHPSATEILGEPAFPNLAAVPVTIDTVVVFRPAAEAAEVTRQAVEVGARAVWLQLGITSPEARAVAAAAGIGYVEDACTKVVARVHHIRKERRTSG